MAMKCTRTLAYAIQATVLLARRESDTPVACSHLAREGEMPERFLLQVLRGLVNGRILSSTRGVDGGYSLARPPAQITLLQIVDAFETTNGNLVPAITSESNGMHDQLQTAFRRAQEASRREIEKLTIADLLSSVQHSSATH